MNVISKVSVGLKKKDQVRSTVIANSLLNQCNVLYSEGQETGESLSLAAEAAWRLYGRGKEMSTRGSLETLWAKLIDEGVYEPHKASRQTLDTTINKYFK